MDTSSFTLCYILRRVYTLRLLYSSVSFYGPILLLCGKRVCVLGGYEELLRTM